MKGFIDSIPSRLPDGWYDYLIEPIAECWVVIAFIVMLLWLVIESFINNKDRG